MSWNPLSNSKKILLELSYQYHKPASNNLVLYNIGSKNIRQITLSINCKSGDKHTILIKEIVVKTGELIKINEIENCQITSAEIARVEVSTQSFQYTFIPENNKFRIK
jgi:hypothetical protein